MRSSSLKGLILRQEVEDREEGKTDRIAVLRIKNTLRTFPLGALPYILQASPDIIV